jgi:hypothetical protein
MPSPAIFKTIGRVDMLDDISNCDNRLIGRANMSGDVINPMILSFVSLKDSLYSDHFESS